MNLYSQNSSIPSIPPFKPKDLFRKGEQGVWYDPSDMSTLYQDVSGSIPVTAVEQPVGLMLDKSKGLVLGPELLKNGTFDTDVSGWTPVRNLVLDWVSGEARVTTSEIFRNYFTQNIPTVVGRLYKATATVRAGTYTGGIEFSVYGGAGGTGATNPTSNTTLVFYFTATSTTYSVQIVTSTGTTAGLTYFVDNISVCELPGNHASQSTAAARPVLSARYNLLRYTEEFDNSYWYKATTNVTVAQNATTDPLGGNTADKLVATNANGVHYILANYPTGFPAETYTFSVYAKAAEYGWLRLLLGGSGGINNPCYFNLNTGAFDTVGSGYTASSTSIGNGWYKVYVSGTTTGVTIPLISPAPSNGTDSFQGNDTSGIYIWGADLRVANDGIGLPAYQRVGAGNADYDTIGFPKYLKFDGVDDCLYTSNVDFTTTNKVTVWAGVRKLSDAASGMIVESSSNSGLSALGAFALLASSQNSAGGASAPYTNYTTSVHTTNTSGTDASYIAYWMTGNEYAASISSVIATTYNLQIASPSAVGLQVNAAIPTRTAQSVSFYTGTLLSGNFGNYPFFIGSRNNSSERLNGRIYSLIVRGAQSTDAQIARTERWVNDKTKAWG